MHRVIQFIAALGFAFAMISCASTHNGPQDMVDAEVDELAVMLTGTFDSRVQAERAPDDFFHIRLVMVPIWTEREDGRWLYVEQAAASDLKRPYRQRIYHVHRDRTGQLRSDVYTLPGEPLDFAGGWADGTTFDSLRQRDLEPRDGCSILITRVGAWRFEGATEGHGCASALRGASYATSEVVIEPRTLTSWDRGWKADGTQAWGATAGGYEFVKRSTMPPSTEATP